MRCGRSPPPNGRGRSAPGSGRHRGRAARGGAAGAAPAYGLFPRDLTPASDAPGAAPPPHMEFLIDRQGYIRARWLARDRDGWGDPARLVAEVERLAAGAGGDGWGVPTRRSPDSWRA